MRPLRRSNSGAAHPSRRTLAVISDYGLARGEGDGVRLVCLFDTGFGEHAVHVRFEDGKVAEVVEQPLE